MGDDLGELRCIASVCYFFDEENFYHLGIPTYSYVCTYLHERKFLLGLRLFYLVTDVGLLCEMKLLTLSFKTQRNNIVIKWNGISIFMKQRTYTCTSMYYHKINSSGSYKGYSSLVLVFCDVRRGHIRLAKFYWSFLQRWLCQQQSS